MKLKSEVEDLLFQRHMPSKGGNHEDVKTMPRLPAVESIAENDVPCAQSCRADGGLKSINGTDCGAPLSSPTREAVAYSGTDSAVSSGDPSHGPKQWQEAETHPSEIHLPEQRHVDDGSPTPGEPYVDPELRRMPANISDCPLGLRDAKFPPVSATKGAALGGNRECTGLAEVRHETPGVLSSSHVDDSLVRFENCKSPPPSPPPTSSSIFIFSHLLPFIDENTEEDGSSVEEDGTRGDEDEDAWPQVEKDTPWDHWNACGDDEQDADNWYDKEEEEDHGEIGRPLFFNISHELYDIEEDEPPEIIAAADDCQEPTTSPTMEDSPSEDQQTPIYSPDSDVASCPTIVVTKDDCDASENCPQHGMADRRVLKSVLKKGRGQAPKEKGKVTFDEAVTMYSDDTSDIQVLALRTADLSYADVFYMFEPPLEYQDLLPFEPPVEYRDPEDHQQTGIEYQQTLPELMSEECEVFDSIYDDDDGSFAEEASIGAQQYQGDNRRDHELIMPPVDGGEVGAVSMATSFSFESKGAEDETHQQGSIEISRCDEMLQRFVEGETQSGQNELAGVFSNLDEELALDGKNGAFDDEFFRKLLHLLSSLEGNSPLQLEDDDLFTSTDFCLDGSDAQSDDTSEATPKYSQEVDSDCSVSSQDTIIIKTSDDSDRNEQDLGEILEPSAQCFEKVSVLQEEDLVESEPSEKHSMEKIPVPKQSSVDSESAGETHKDSGDERNASGSLSAQTSTEEPSIGHESVGDPIQETDDSTSSDSRSGDVEEDIRQDDVGYDEEDAEDDDDESLKGMAKSNSKIRRIIKRNAIQCTLLRGIEARRRETGNFARPKSPLPSRNSLVEQLRWLTTVEETNDGEHDTVSSNKEPKVPQNPPLEKINVRMASFSTTSSEDEPLTPVNRVIPAPRAFQEYSETRVMPQYRPLNPGGMYAPIRPNPSPTQHPAMIRRWLDPNPNHQQRVVARVTVPGDFRDWRVIQRVVVNRDGVQQQVIRGAFKSQFSQRMPIPGQPQGVVEPTFPRPDVTCVERRPDAKILRPGPFPGGGHDELEQFVKQDIERIERIRKRYSLAEEDEDPTFGFGRRPSVRGIRTRFGSTTEIIKHLQTTASTAPLSSQSVITSHGGAVYATPDRLAMNPSHPQAAAANQWSRPINQGHVPLYRPTPLVKEPHQAAFEIHRASVAMGDLPPHVGTPPEGHYYPGMEHRYHSYAENIYGSTRSLNPPAWNRGNRLTPSVHTTAVAQPKMAPPPVPPVQPPPPPRSAPVTQQPPPLIYSYVSKDERGTPEGASSSPKVSSDSLYHGSPQDQQPPTDPARKDGVIYYSLNV